MSVTIVEEKIRQLPENYVSLVNDYVDSLLEKVKKIDALRGSLSNYADENLRKQEKDAWQKEAAEKHLNG